MTNKVDNKLRYSAIIDNRSVIAAICINELEFLITQTDFVQDRQMLQSMICGCGRQIDTDNPLKLETLCNIIDCKVCNSCKTCNTF